MQLRYTDLVTAELVTHDNTVVTGVHAHDGTFDVRSDGLTLIRTNPDIVTLIDDDDSPIAPTLPPAEGAVSPDMLAALTILL